MPTSVARALEGMADTAIYDFDNCLVEKRVDR
jgi:hypothetical protein